MESDEIRASASNVVLVHGPCEGLSREQVVLRCHPRRKLDFGGLDPDDVYGDPRARWGHIGAVLDRLTLCGRVQRQVLITDPTCTPSSCSRLIVASTSSVDDWVGMRPSTNFTRRLSRVGDSSLT